MRTRSRIFPARQLIYRHSGHLACDVPESYLDRAHRRTPGLGRTKPADLQQHALDVRRVFANNVVPIKEHHRLEIRLGGLGLTVPGDALIRDDSNYQVPADDCATEVCGFDGSMPGPLFRERLTALLLSRKRCCGRYPPTRSEA